MGMNNNVLGLIFASINDSAVIDLTKQRTMGSIPFGGRYRLIDFPLSNMVNSGIQEVGVITKSNYGSLMDHLGSGREWDLARKKGGLHLLPPFSQVGGGVYQGRLEALNNVWNFIEYTQSEFVVLANCDVVANVDFSQVIAQHAQSGADITIVYAKGLYRKEKNSNTNILTIDEEQNVTEVLVHPDMAGECNICLDMFVMRTDFLKKIVQESASKSQHSLIRDILQRRKDEFVFKAYEHKDCFFKIDSLESYYKTNLKLQESEVRKSLFNSEAPIYTKTGDNAPVKYGLDSNVKNSSIADGCMIEGTVENCILFRGVKIGKGAVVKNCVLMQGTVVGEKCCLECIVADKNVEISAERVLTGSEEYPLYLGKKAKI
ncbi:MAG: glucose-1-phosphate adenylyltransferase subunit GlgD [Ruminococcus sp.]